MADYHSNAVSVYPPAPPPSSSLSSDPPRTTGIAPKVQRVGPQITDDTAGPSLTTAQSLPFIQGVPYVDVTLPDGRRVMPMKNQTILVDNGSGEVHPQPLSDVFASLTPPQPPTPRVVPAQTMAASKVATVPTASAVAANAKEKELVLDIPVLPDAVDEMVQNVIEKGVDALADAAKKVTSDEVDVLIDKAVEEVGEVVEREGEKLGFFKKRKAQEDKVNQKIADFEETVFNHPGIKQGIDTFRGFASSIAEAIREVLPNHKFIVNKEG
jgi:hypothetical protein